MSLEGSSDRRLSLAAAAANATESERDKDADETTDSPALPQSQPKDSDLAAAVNRLAQFTTHSKSTVSNNKRRHLAAPAARTTKPQQQPGPSVNGPGKSRNSVSGVPGNVTQLPVLSDQGSNRNASVAPPSSRLSARQPSSQLGHGRRRSVSKSALINHAMQHPDEQSMAAAAASLGIIGSRPGSRLGSPPTWTENSRPTSPSEMIVAVERVKKIQTENQEKQKARLIQSAGAKLPTISIRLTVPTAAAPLIPRSNEEPVTANEFSILRGRENNIATLVQAKMVAAKWRMNALKKAETIEAAKQVVNRLDLHSAPVQRQRCSDVIAPVVNGMRIFGINKGGITRAIVKFNGPPPSCPLTVCFHFPSVFLTHKYVLDMVRAKIAAVHDARVTTIQFIDRNTLHGTQGLDNRWLVTMNCEGARDMILQKGLHLFNRHIVVRPYDEILIAEYHEYLEYLGMQKRMCTQMRELGVGSIGSDLIPDSLKGVGGDATKVLVLPKLSQHQ